MFDDGIILGEYDVEAKRNGMNEHDWFGDGYTKDSKFILHGKEYKLDDEGHLNIPKGEGCLMRDLIRIKQKSTEYVKNINTICFIYAISDRTYHVSVF